MRAATVVLAALSDVRKEADRPTSTSPNRRFGEPTNFAARRSSSTPSLVVASLLLAAGLAGCVSPSAGVATSAVPDPAATPASVLEATGCTEGGGHSVLPRWEGLLPEPWEYADVLEDVGPQLAYTANVDPEHPIPSEGHTWGNYHATLACKRWVLDGEERPMMMGFVATRVEPPPFDDGTAARHYLVTVVSTDDEGLARLLHEAGLHVTGFRSGTLEWPSPGVFHTMLDTEDHGVYEAVFKAKDVGEKPAGVTRLWWQAANGDGTFRPVALDLADSGGRHLWAEGTGWFSHLRTEDHAPLPGAGTYSPGLVWAGFDRRVALGPRPPVVLEEAYLH